MDRYVGVVKFGDTLLKRLFSWRNTPDIVLAAKSIFFQRIISFSKRNNNNPASNQLHFSL